MDDALRSAYRDAEYVVFGDAPLAFRVGAPSEALDRLLDSHGVDCAAFITAFNPWGRRAGEAANQAAQERLRQYLRGRQLRFLEGEGRDPAGAWPAEASALVLGMPRESAAKLGRGLAQNAIVFIARGAAPELVELA